MNNTADRDGCVDAIVATCDGDLRGALRALLLVNEQLERELRRVSALSMRPTVQALAGSVLHRA